MSLGVSSVYTDGTVIYMYDGCMAQVLVWEVKVHYITYQKYDSTLSSRFIHDEPKSLEE